MKKYLTYPQAFLMRLINHKAGILETILFTLGLLALSATLMHWLAPGIFNKY